MADSATGSGRKKRRGSGFTVVRRKSALSLEGPAVGRPRKHLSACPLEAKLCFEAVSRNRFQNMCMKLASNNWAQHLQAEVDGYAASGLLLKANELFICAPLSSYVKTSEPS